jgi:hypothetical protein
MIFYCITACLEEINHLSKKKKSLTSSCKKDISKFFKNKSLTDLITIPDFISGDENTAIVVKKFRVHNSRLNQGSRSASRLYVLINKDEESVCLLAFYPKTGPSGQSSITHEEYDYRLQLYQHEKNELIELDLSNDHLIEKEN